jgi:RPA family protein
VDPTGAVVVVAAQLEALAALQDVDADEASLAVVGALGGTTANG